MNEKNTSLKIAAIGDLHSHEKTRGKYRGLFKEISERADVLALCGDLTNLGLPEEAEILAEDLRGFHMPILAVLGNHDYHHNLQERIEQILCDAGVFFLKEEEVFQIGQVGIAGTKGFAGGFENFMLGSFGEPEIKAFVEADILEVLRLENSLKILDTPKKVVVLHYSPISETVRGEPLEIFPFLGSSRLAEVIDRFDVRLVVHGHAHHGAFEGQTIKGIPVFNTALEVLKKTGRDYLLFEV